MTTSPNPNHNPDLEPIQFVNIGGIYQHYKGTRYKVIDIAVHTENKEKLVLYRTVIGDIIWARPISMFSDVVINADGKECLRFKLCDDYHTTMIKSLKQ
jgi:hypothetical protein